MNDFLLLKLNRSVWVALLEERKILEAIGYFESYQANLAMFRENKELKEDVVEEISFSQGFFLSKITDIAEKYFNDENYAMASICYTSILKYNHYNGDTIKNYIECLDKLEQFDLETEIIEHLEKVVPNDVSLYKMLAETYDKKGNNYKSVEYLEKYFDKREMITSIEYNLLGCYYNKLYSDNTHKIEDVIKSLDNFSIACDMEPYNKLYIKNATIMAAKSNDYETGRKYWDKLLELDNLSNDDKYDYAAFCLKNKDFDGWHKYFGARFKKENNPTAFPKINKPEWNGVKDIRNSTLLIYYEQGFVDTFLMWGYMPRIVNLTKHIIFVVEYSIYYLLKDNEYGIEVLAKSSIDLAKLKFDYYIPSMSIPIALKLAGRDLSVGKNYIKVKPEIVKSFKEKYFNNDKLKIGISFAGSISGNHSRDISVDKFLPLDNLKNIEIYSITKEISDDSFKIFKNNKVINLAKEFNTFEDTAAAIENMDVVITSDNCILNLAGALGKKTLALFNWHYEFRWFDLTGDNVVWLTSVKPFVNDGIDNWEYSINNTIKEIEKIKKPVNV